MAKNKKNPETGSATENKLAMVPAAGLAPAPALGFVQLDAAIPKDAKKLTLPPLVKPEQIPVGALVTAKIVALAESISGREDMRKSKLLHLSAIPAGDEFLFPFTGVIKKALGGDEGAAKAVGKTLYLKRTADGSTTKYGGVKKVFMFDIYLSDK